MHLPPVFVREVCSLSIPVFNDCSGSEGSDSGSASAAGVGCIGSGRWVGLGQVGFWARFWLQSEDGFNCRLVFLQCVVLLFRLILVFGFWFLRGFGFLALVWS